MPIGSTDPGWGYVYREVSSGIVKGCLTSLKVPLRCATDSPPRPRARGVTMRKLLDDVSHEAVDAVLMDEAAAQMIHLRKTDPAAWTEYLAEGRSWEDATGERFDT